MKILNKKLLLVAVMMLALAGAGVFYWLSRSDDGVTRIVNEVPNNSDDQNTDNNQNEPEEDKDPQEEDPDTKPVKEPSPSSNVNVTEAPLVYTGYGHSQDDPLTLSQETSTTCTTVPGAMCSISFKSSDGKTAKLEAKKADSQGIVVWNWLGKEVGSGTWSVTAVAGDKTSSIETIYIQ